jgi:hypothetical protein
VRMAPDYQLSLTRMNGAIRGFCSMRFFRHLPLYLKNRSLLARRAAR